MIDAHIHLCDYPKDQWDSLIADWQGQGISGVVAVSKDLKSTLLTLELKQRYGHFIYAAVGYHPEQAPPSERELLELEKLLKQERSLISAVGEVGLPHYTPAYTLAAPMSAHKEALEHMCHWAKAYRLPVLLHAVHDKADFILQLLQGMKLEKAHFHWLKATPEVLNRIIKSRFYISVTPEVCYRRRDQALLKEIPLEQLLLETDGPWQFAGPFQDRMTSPLFLKEMVPVVARMKEVSIEQLVTQSTQNTYRLLCGK
jgi:TatD DNase family protein